MVEQKSGVEREEKSEKKKGRLYNRIKLIIRVCEYNIVKWRV